MNNEMKMIVPTNTEMFSFYSDVHTLYHQLSPFANQFFFRVTFWVTVAIKYYLCFDPYKFNYVLLFDLKNFAPADYISCF